MATAALDYADAHSSIIAIVARVSEQASRHPSLRDPTADGHTGKRQRGKHTDSTQVGSQSAVGVGGAYLEVVTIKSANSAN